MPTLETNLTNPQTPIEREIAALGPWFHNIHLGGGVQTAPEHPLGDFPACKWRQIAEWLPEDLTGVRVLDIGCNAGFYSFETARRGAVVTGIDSGARYLEQARWAAKQIGLEDVINFRELNVYDLERLGEAYDLVLFMGVFYHLRHPLLALDLVRTVSRHQMVFQTLMMPGDEVAPEVEDMPIADLWPLTGAGWPKMAFVEHRVAGDPSNWWLPNHAAVLALLRSSGFAVVGRPAGDVYMCEVFTK